MLSDLTLATAVRTIDPEVFDFAAVPIDRGELLTGEALNGSLPVQVMLVLGALKTGSTIFSLSASNLPSGTPPEMQSKADDVISVFGSYPLPSVHLRLGWQY